MHCLAGLSYNQEATVGVQLSGGIMLSGRNSKKVGGNPAPVPTLPPRFPSGVTRNLTRQ
jgi:hypothetical protein